MQAAWHCESSLSLNLCHLKPSGSSEHWRGRRWGGRIATRPRSGLRLHSELIHGLINGGYQSANGNLANLPRGNLEHLWQEPSGCRLLLLGASEAPEVLPRQFW